MSNAALQQTSSDIQGLYIDESEGRGRGVFTSAFFRKGEVVDECIALVLSKVEGQVIDEQVPSLANYQFAWNESDPKAAFAFLAGFGPLYNHSVTGNLILKRDFAQGKMRFIASRNIEAHEELTFDYGIPLWFLER